MDFHDSATVGPHVKKSTLFLYFYDFAAFSDINILNRCHVKLPEEHIFRRGGIFQVKKEILIFSCIFFFFFLKKEVPWSFFKDGLLNNSRVIEQRLFPPAWKEEKKKKENFLNKKWI